MIMHSDNASQTLAVLNLLNRLPVVQNDDSVHSDLVKLLADHGSERLSLPVLLDAVSHFDGSNTLNGSSAALGRLCRSRDPVAVHFLMSRLADISAASEVRSAAYTSLASSGAADAIAAVLAFKDKPDSPMPALRALMDLDKLRTTVAAVAKKTEEQPEVELEVVQPKARLLAIRADNRGVTWALFSSGVLGSWGDLWIVPREAGGMWGNPIFTAIDSTSDQAFSQSRDARPFAIDGMSLKQFIEKGAWVSKFANDPALTRDTDGDGWSDLVEDRLGTNPQSADTDGDGKSDSVGRNPCGARVPSGDSEELLGAAFDARFRFLDDASSGPLLVTFPTGTSPFRLSGYGGVIIGQSADSKAHKKLSNLYGEGVGIVEFFPSSSDFSGSELNRRFKAGRIDDVIVWNAAHTEGTVGIRVYYGGLNGSIYEMRVRKIGIHWIVVNSRVTVVS